MKSLCSISDHVAYWFWPDAQVLDKRFKIHLYQRVEVKSLQLMHCQCLNLYNRVGVLVNTRRKPVPFPYC